MFDFDVDNENNKTYIGDLKKNIDEIDSLNISIEDKDFLKKSLMKNIKESFNSSDVISEVYEIQNNIEMLFFKEYKKLINPNRGIMSNEFLSNVYAAISFVLKVLKSHKHVLSKMDNLHYDKELIKLITQWDKFNSNKMSGYSVNNEHFMILVFRNKNYDVPQRHLLAAEIHKNAENIVSFLYEMFNDDDVIKEMFFKNSELYEKIKKIREENKDMFCINKLITEVYNV